MKCIAVRFCYNDEVKACNLASHVEQIGGVTSCSVTQEPTTDGMWSGHFRFKVVFVEGSGKAVKHMVESLFKGVEIQDYNVHDDTGYEWQDMTEECRED